MGGEDEDGAGLVEFFELGVVVVEPAVEGGGQVCVVGESLEFGAVGAFADDVDVPVGVESFHGL